MVTEAYYKNGLYPTQKSVTKLTVCANERIIRELVRFLRYVYLTSESQISDKTYCGGYCEDNL